MNEISASQKLENLTAALVADIMSMSSEEILAEAVEELGSVEAVEAEIRRLAMIILQTIHGSSTKNGADKCM